MLKDGKKMVEAVADGKKLLKDGNGVLDGSAKRKTIVKALVAGVALGATLGVMIAPDKGSKTRKKVKRTAQAVKEKVQTLAEDLHITGKQQSVDSNLA